MTTTSLSTNDVRPIRDDEIEEVFDRNELEDRVRRDDCGGAVEDDSGHEPPPPGHLRRLFLLFSRIPTMSIHLRRLAIGFIFGFVLINVLFAVEAPRDCGPGSYCAFLDQMACARTSCASRRIPTRECEAIRQVESVASPAPFANSVHFGFTLPTYTISIGACKVDVPSVFPSSINQTPARRSLVTSDSVRADRKAPAPPLSDLVCALLFAFGMLCTATVFANPFGVFTYVAYFATCWLIPAHIFVSDLRTGPGGRHPYEFKKQAALQWYCSRWFLGYRKGYSHDELREAFRSTGYRVQKVSNESHTHGYSAGVRAAANKFAIAVARRVGYYAQFLQASRTAVRRSEADPKNIGADLAIFWGKENRGEGNVRPIDWNLIEKHHRLADGLYGVITVTCDQDFYQTPSSQRPLEDTLNDREHPSIIITKCPSRVGFSKGTSTGDIDFSMTFFKDAGVSKVRYLVGGGALYEHSLYNYNKDSYTLVKYNDYGMPVKITTLLCETKYIKGLEDASDHPFIDTQVVLLIPTGFFTGVSAIAQTRWSDGIKKSGLTMLDPVTNIETAPGSGQFYTVMMDNMGGTDKKLNVSVGVTDTYHSCVVTSQQFAAIAYQSLQGNITNAQVTQILRLPDGKWEPEYGVLTAYFNAKRVAMGFKAAEFVTHNGNVPTNIVQKSAVPLGKACLRPLTDTNPCPSDVWIHQNNKDPVACAQSVLERVVGEKLVKKTHVVIEANTIRRATSNKTSRLEIVNEVSVPAPPSYANRFLRIFARAVLGDNVGKLSPVDIEVVAEKQNTPAQKLQQTVSGVTTSGISGAPIATQTFLKTSAMRTPSEACRNITTLKPHNKVLYSQFMYALTAAVKTGPFKDSYGFRPASEIAARVHTVVNSSLFVDGVDRSGKDTKETDFSKMDARVTELARMLESVIIMLAFSPKYVDQALKLWSSGIACKAFYDDSKFYNQGTSRQSGSPETSIFNTLLTMAINLLAFLFQHLPGWEKESDDFVIDFLQRHAVDIMVVGGDDGVVKHIDSEKLIRASEIFGQVMKVIVRTPQQAVSFFSRIYPNIWCPFPDENSLTSCSDVLRAFSKMCYTAILDQNIPREIIFLEKCRSILVNDANTPILGDYADAIVQCARMCRLLEGSDSSYQSAIADKYIQKIAALSRDWTPHEPGSTAYPNTDLRALHSYVVSALGPVAVQTFSDWLQEVTTAVYLLSLDNAHVSDPVERFRICVQPLLRPPVVYEGSFHNAMNPPEPTDAPLIIDGFLYNKMDPDYQRRTEAAIVRTRNLKQLYHVDGKVYLRAYEAANAILVNIGLATLAPGAELGGPVIMKSNALITDGAETNHATRRAERRRPPNTNVSRTSSAISVSTADTIASRATTAHSQSNSRKTRRQRKPRQ